MGSRYEFRIFPQNLRLIQVKADQEKVHSLTWVFLKFYKWPILAGVLPRACRIAFRFAQPFLVQRTINYMSESDGPNTRNIGYGLIGAYALVYIGIAVGLSRAEIRIHLNEL